MRSRHTSSALIQNTVSDRLIVCMAMVLYDEAFAVDQLERLLRVKQDDAFKYHVTTVQKYVTESLRQNLSRRLIVDDYKAYHSLESQKKLVLP